MQTNEALNTTCYLRIMLFVDVHLSSMTNCSLFASQDVDLCVLSDFDSFLKLTSVDVLMLSCLSPSP
jgi:hypothetical protein